MTKQAYDAVVVLGAGIVKTPAGTFVPTTYDDSDPFGMLGGEVRILAAAELSKQYADKPVVFTTGVTAKTIEQYGPKVPTEAAVYRRTFQDILHTQKQKVPPIILEDSSVNTIGNIQQCMLIASLHNWKRIAVITSDYHCQRVAELIGMIGNAAGSQADFTCLSAEAILRTMQPGVHDARVKTAYESPQARIRLENEAKGIDAIRSGSYVIGEFQLHQREARSA